MEQQRALPENPRTHLVSWRDAVAPPINAMNGASYFLLMLRLLVMTVALAAVIYRWRSESASLLVLLLGFVVGLLLTLLYRSRRTYK
jgi:hypothetical protein